MLCVSTPPLPSVELAARLLAGIFLTLANAFFVATECALTRLPQFDERELQDPPPSGARGR